MPPPTTSQPRPLHLPSTLPSPLTKAIRDRTLTSLLASNTIPTLQRTLRAECTAAGWKSRGGLKRGREGEEEEEEEYEDDGLGMMVPKKRAKTSGTETEIEEGSLGTEKKKQKVDVRIPEQAVQAGTKIVKDALEKVVVIEDGGLG
ncbi:hypothetical protein G7Y79_00079g100420 [Physcia stellaris]|nr:hypothetical protein G7Y79_00079g100420 [Physcia stellaris]